MGWMCFSSLKGLLGLSFLASFFDTCCLLLVVRLFAFCSLLLFVFLFCLSVYFNVCFRKSCYWLHDTQGWLIIFTCCPIYGMVVLEERSWASCACTRLVPIGPLGLG